MNEPGLRPYGRFLNQRMKSWLPLKGIRVLSFELAFALPAGTKALHDLGAEVVRVTPPARQVDPYIGILDGVFQGKSCLSIDLTKEQGAFVAQRLAKEADVVCSNFRPHVLRKYGLGARALREQHPRLITLQLSGYGTPGPYSDYPAFGPSTEAAGGLNRLLAGPDDIPIRIGSAVFSDQLAGRYAALAIVHALERRRRTGEGQSIDLSMTAGITHMLGQPVTEALRTGEMSEVPANRDRRFVPQGVYRSANDGANTDEWVAISVETDKEWRTLCEVLADTEIDLTHIKADWRDWSVDTRWQHHGQIDLALSELSAQHTKDALAERLQAVGVPAAPVRTTADQALDSNLQARAMLQMVKHRTPLLGYVAHPHPVLPWRIAGRKRRRLTPNHHSGEDNARVLGDWLQMDAADIKQLYQSEVLHKRADQKLKPRRRRSNHDPEHAQKLGLQKLELNKPGPQH